MNNSHSTQPRVIESQILHYVFKKFLESDESIEDEYRVMSCFETAEQFSNQCRFACPDLSGHHQETLFTLDPVKKTCQSFPVKGAIIKKFRVGSQVEWRFPKAEIFQIQNCDPLTSGDEIIRLLGVVMLDRRQNRQAELFFDVSFILDAWI